MISENISSASDPRDTYGYSNFAYDAVYAMALALNETHNQLQPDRWLTDFTYRDNNITQMLINNCYKVNFSGITVS